MLTFASDTQINTVFTQPGTAQGTNTAKTSDGVEIVRESIYIKHFAADEDGTLKITRDEEFTDSKAYLDAIQAVAAAKAKGQQ